MGLRDVFQRSADRVKVRASRTMEGLSGIVAKPSIDEAIKKIEDRFVAPEQMIEALRRIEATEARMAQVEDRSARALQELARIAGLEDRLAALEREFLAEHRRFSRIVRQGIVAAVVLAAGEIIIWYITRPVVIP